MFVEAVTPESASKEVFHSSSFLAAGFLCLRLFSFLGQRFPHFFFIAQMSVLVGKKLTSFLAVVLLIITVFALMFYGMFLGSSECGEFCSF
jgi:hypothetical protein